MTPELTVKPQYYRRSPLTQVTEKGITVKCINIITKERITSLETSENTPGS